MLLWIWYHSRWDLLCSDGRGGAVAVTMLAVVAIMTRLSRTIFSFYFTRAFTPGNRMEIIVRAFRVLLPKRYLACELACRSVASLQVYSWVLSVPHVFLRLILSVTRLRVPPCEEDRHGKCGNIHRSGATVFPKRSRGWLVGFRG